MPAAQGVAAKLNVDWVSIILFLFRQQPAATAVFQLRTLMPHTSVELFIYVMDCACVELADKFT